MTEDEAKTKVCCGPPGTNAMMHGIEVGADEVNTSCIAFGCMAWRWTIKPGPDHDAGIAAHPPSGFCGLAGRPA